MTTHPQFYEGQEVEAYYPFSRSNESTWPWVKAKIVAPYAIPDGLPRGQLNEQFFVDVQFRDGSRAVVGAEHIRAADPRDEVFPRALQTSEAEHRTMLAGDSAEEYSGLAEPDDDTSEPMGRIP